jgi:hypothetical protein
MAFPEEEIHIIQARRAARAARTAREARKAAGLPEELEPPQKRSFQQRRVLGKMLLVFLAGLMVLAAAMFRYWHASGRV